MRWVAHARPACRLRRNAETTFHWNFVVDNSDLKIKSAVPSPTRQHARRMRYPNAIRWPESVILRHRVPVHNVPPRFEIIGAAVLIFQVIGVLPHIDAEDGRVPVHQRAVLIWRGNDFKTSILILDEPCPAAAEAAHTSSSNFLFEIIKAAERGIDIVGEFAFGLAAGVRAHDLPKE